MQLVFESCGGEGGVQGRSLGLQVWDLHGEGSPTPSKAV